MGALSQIDGQRMIKALIRLGWSLARVEGSHHILFAPGRATLSVPVHRGRPLREGTARAILRQASISPEEFLRAY